MKSNTGSLEFPNVPDRRTRRPLPRVAQGYVEHAKRVYARVQLQGAQALFGKGSQERLPLFRSQCVAGLLDARVGSPDTILELQLKGRKRELLNLTDREPQIIQADKRHVERFERGLASGTGGFLNQLSAGLDVKLQTPRSEKTRASALPGCWGSCLPLRAYRTAYVILYTIEGTMATDCAKSFLPLQVKRMKSPEEKALTQLAVALRRQAFRERVALLNAARQRAELEVSSSPQEAAANEARMATDRLRTRRTEALADVDRQIAQLQAYRAELANCLDAEVQKATDQRKAALNGVFEVRRQALAAAQEPFADVLDVYSAAAWKPLDEFLAQAKAMGPAARPTPKKKTTP